MADKQHYLWSTLTDGGKTDTIIAANGNERRVVISRNTKPAGSKISKSDASNDEEWEAWLEAGVVRPYPYPEDLAPGSTDSPVVHLQKKLTEAASTQEELLTAQVQGATTGEEALVEATKDTDKK
jgi:hypothetical protein